MDYYTLTEVFKLLDYKTQYNMYKIFSKQYNLFECIYELKASNDMTDKKLMLYKNLQTLDCYNNYKFYRY